MNSASLKVQPEDAETGVPILEQLTAYFAQVAPGSLSQNLTAETPLLGSGLLDSLGILQFTMFLTDSLGVEISDEDFTPDNFATIGSVVALVERKLGERA